MDTRDIVSRKVEIDETAYKQAQSSLAPAEFRRLYSSETKVDYPGGGVGVRRTAYYRREAVDTADAQVMLLNELRESSARHEALLAEMRDILKLFKWMAIAALALGLVSAIVTLVSAGKMM